MVDPGHQQVMGCLDSVEWEWWNGGILVHFVLGVWIQWNGMMDRWNGGMDFFSSILFASLSTNGLVQDHGTIWAGKKRH